MPPFDSFTFLEQFISRKLQKSQEKIFAYGKGEDLLVIENIPVISCPHCGEGYLTAKTLHEIEKIKRNRKNLAIARFVEVAKFDEGNSPVAV